MIYWILGSNFESILYTINNYFSQKLFTSFSILKKKEKENRLPKKLTKKKKNFFFALTKCLCSAFVQNLNSNNQELYNITLSFD